MFGLFIVGGLVGVKFSSGTDAFLSFTMAWAALLAVLVVTSFSMLVPRFKKNNLIISHTIFPAYEWVSFHHAVFIGFYWFYCIYWFSSMLLSHARFN